MCLVDKYGADAIRLYLINSPVVRAEPLKFVESGVQGEIKVLHPQGDGGLQTLHRRSRARLIHQQAHEHLRSSEQKKNQGR